MIRVQDYDPELAAELGLLSEMRERHYQVVYRVADTHTALGSRQERYDGVTERLRSMNAAEHSDEFEDAGHVATSTWVVAVNEDYASAILNSLKASLEPGIDILRVVEIVQGNEAEL